MAKAKGRRGDRNPDPKPAPALASSTRPVAVGIAPTHDVVTTALLLLGLCATLYIWLYQPLEPRTQLQLTGVVWAVAIFGAVARLHARRAVVRLRATLAHDQAVNARLVPDITEAQSGLRMRHISSWLVAVIGIVGTAVVWQTDAIERQVGGLTPMIVGSTVSVLIALAVAANALNRMKAKRLARDFRIALASERLALGTLEGVHVMVCASLPNGERTRFNERYMQFLGRTAAQLQGMGWLECVQADDRQSALDIAAEPLSARRTARQHDVCVRRATGERAWLRETLTPRLDDKGNLIEYICTAIDITAHVETEAALDKQVGGLNTELAETKAELVKIKTARNRFEKNLEELRDEVTALQSALAKAESTLEKVQSESAARIREVEADARQRIQEAEEESDKRARKAEQSSEGRLEKLEETAKTAKQELQAAATENKKLSRAFEKLQDELVELRQQDSEAREQLVRHIKETREARSEVTESHTREAQNRAKAERLAQRCDELEKQLAGKDAAVASASAQAQQAGVAAAAEVERRLHEVSAEALAKQLRTQLDSMQRMTSELLATSLAGPVQDAAYNTAASLRSMSDLVDQAIGVGDSKNGGKANRKPAAAKTIASSAGGESFDLRRTAHGVRDLLIEQARGRGAKLQVEIAPKLPALVHGDDIEIRTMLLSLLNAALMLVEDGSLVLRLSEDVNTGAHSTIRCEIRHSTAKVRNETLETMLAIKSTDDDMPDAAAMPQAHQAAKAWRTVRRLQGQHGYMLPDEGGFMLWCTFTLERPAAAANAATESVDAKPAAAKSVVEEPAPVAAAAAAPPSAPAPAASSSKSRSLRAAMAAVTDVQSGGDTMESRHASTTSASAGAKAGNEAPRATTNELELMSSYVGSGPAEEVNAPRQPVSMPRMPQELLVCNLGEVVELGGDSIRIFCSKPPKSGAQTTIAFNTVETDLQIRAEVTWSKKISRGKHDVGLKFIGVTSADQKRIMTIAMQHRRVTTMLDADERTE